jgi:hypothetical protein
MIADGMDPVEPSSESTTEPQHEPSAAPVEEARRRRPRARLLTIGGAVLVLGVTLVVGGSYLFRERPDAKSIDAAVGDLRHRAGSSTSVAGTAVLPAAGVYELHGSGGEEISFPPNSQDDGTTMPASVQLLSGNCFRWRIDYNQAHWHQLDFCREGDDLLLGPQRNYQRWDFGTADVENIGDFECVPPQHYPLAAPAGTTTRATCHGTNTAVTGTASSAVTTEVIGREDLRIGSATVRTAHLRQHDVLTGAQRGHNDVDWWFDVRTGLPVRARRTYQLASDSPVGSVVYDESGEWTLASTEPRR